MAAAALSAALSMTSCSNEADELSLPAAKKTLSISLTLPDDASTRATFEANMEGDVFKGLKTKWEMGDEVSVGKIGSGENAATFKATSVSDDGKTATFSGEAPSSWGEIADGTEFWFTYPKLSDGEKDCSAQEGTLATLPNYDYLWIYATYSGGAFGEAEIERQSVFFRLPKDLAICDAEFTGNITLEFTGKSIISKYVASSEDNFVFADADHPIEVGPVAVESGALTSDVYVSLPWYFSSHSHALNMAVKSSEATKLYTLDYELKRGNIYTLTSMSKLITVGMVIGSDGKYYATASDVPTGVTAEAMIAYLGTEAEGATHGLAIALEDASSKVTWDNIGSNNGGKTAAELVADWATYNAVTDGTWRLPSADDWKYMFQGCGGDTYKEDLTDRMEFSYGDFRTKLIAAGGESADVQSVYYWSATEFGSGSAWSYYFNNGKFETASKSSHIYVRAVLAF